MSTIKAKTIAVQNSAGTAQVDLTFDGSSNSSITVGVKPMFSAYQSVGQSLANSTYTKIPFQTKEFDLTNAFDNVTNFRFQPNKAGYYQVFSCVCPADTSGGKFVNNIFKNGLYFKAGNSAISSSTLYPTSSVSAIIYMNGSTDYLEVYVYSSLVSATSTAASSQQTFFQATYIANGV